MKICKQSFEIAALGLCFLALGVSCSGQKTYEGTVETTLAFGGISEDGLRFSMENTFVCRQGKFRLLLLSEDCEFVGFEKQKGDGGIAMKIGGKDIVLHSGATYKVRGKIAGPMDGEELKQLQATYFELLKPGIGESKTKAGF
ncbi:MAG: hypothetical protein FJY83_08555 [Candidatus Aminicenantes bacterium]|nr:hypothetical protein [Candidatus Aminicenantes bacterium]